MPVKDPFKRLDNSTYNRLGQKVIFRGVEVVAIVKAGVEVRYATGGEDLSYEQSTVSGFVDTVGLPKDLKPVIGEYVTIDGVPKQLVQLVSATEYSQVFATE